MVQRCRVHLFLCKCIMQQFDRVERCRQSILLFMIEAAYTALLFSTTRQYAAVSTAPFENDSEIAPLPGSDRSGDTLTCKPRSPESESSKLSSMH